MLDTTPPTLTLLETFNKTQVQRKDSNSGTITTTLTLLNLKTLRNPNPLQVVEEWTIYLESTSHSQLSQLLNQSPTRIYLEPIHLLLQEDLTCLMLAAATHHLLTISLVAICNPINLNSLNNLNQHSNLILEGSCQWAKWVKVNLQQQLQECMDNNLIPLETWEDKTWEVKTWEDRECQWEDRIWVDKECLWVVKV
jgi:hypothetical protein